MYRFKSRTDLIIAVALTLSVIMLGCIFIVPGVCGVYHDDGIYISTAKSLAEGSGYHLINLPDSPAQTKYPPLYPLLLSIVWKLSPAFPANVALMQGLSACFAGVATFFSYLYLQRYKIVSRWQIVSAFLICFSCSSYCFFISQALSESCFAMLWMFYLFQAQKYFDSENKSVFKEIVLGIVIALPSLCRYIGLAALIASLIYLLRYKKRIVYVCAGAGLVLAPWFIWLANKISSSGGEFSYYTDYLQWWRAYISVEPWIFICNFFYCFVAPFRFFLPLTHIPPGMMIPISILLIPIMILPWQFLWRIRKEHSFLVINIVVYMLIVLVWPWEPYRFFIPILPLYTCFLIASLPIFWTLLRLQKYSIKISCIVIVLSLLMNAGACFHMYRMTKQYSYPGYMNLKNHPVAWSSYQHVFDWLNEHAQKSDIAVCQLDPMLFLYTGMKGYRSYPGNPLALFYNQPVGENVNSLEEMSDSFTHRNAKYLVQLPAPGFLEDKVFPTLVRVLVHKEPRLKPVYIDSDPRFVIYQYQTDL